MKISIVVPALNEQEGIQQLHNLLDNALGKLPHKATYEIVYVNDGSTDNTLEALRSIASNDTRVKVVSFSRRFGKELAMTAGIAQTTGDAVITLDSDGQHPPEKIGDFIEAWLAGAQVVIGVRQINKHESLVKKLGSRLFYFTFNRLLGAKLTPNTTDFRLIDKEVRRAFLSLQEQNRITRGLIDWLGFKQAYIPFKTTPRIAGKASYRPGMLLRLALDSFVSLSLKPLFLFGWLGAIITLLALLLGVFIIVEQIILGDPLGLNITGSAMLGVFVSFMSGLILMSQGMLAIYLSKIYAQTLGRPLYVIDHSRSVGIDEHNP